MCNQLFIHLEFNDFNSQLLESYNKCKPKLLLSSNTHHLDKCLESIQSESISTCAESLQSMTILMCKGNKNIIYKDRNIHVYDILQKKGT